MMVSSIPILLYRVLKKLRFVDAFIFASIPSLGILFSMYQLTVENINYKNLTMFLVAVYLLALHVFQINDWGDYKNDRNDSDKRKNSQSGSDLTTREILVSSLFLAVLSLILLFKFSISKFLIGLVLLMISLMYSTTLFYLRGKAIVLVASIFHLVGGLLAFLLGYLLYGQLDINALTAGIMFGVFLTAGHLFQELQDLNGDRMNKLITIANTLGKGKSALIGTGLLFTGHAMLQYHIRLNLFPAVTFVNWAAFAIVATFIGFSYKKGFSHTSLKHLRNRYRIVYACFGIYIFIKILFQIH
jgi:4-hydroxybenzoate polyprenyltransferase